jgi:uncharacterized protein DUF4382
MRNRLPTALGVSLAGLSSVLAACSSRTDVSLTGNTPAQYSHVYITTQEVWFNASATAGPEDGGWVKFPLSTPTTVDLVQENGGNLGAITTDLKLVPGSYSQIRVIPVDSSAALTSSAQNVGALYNTEADYVDSAGTTHQLPLELLNPDLGIGIQANTSLKVPIGSVGAALSSTSTGGTTSTGAGITNGTLTGETNGTLTGESNGSVPIGGTTSATGTTGTTNTSTAPNTEFAINVLGTSDLVPFAYGTSSTPGIMLSSHASAYDLTQVAAITGQLSLTNLTGTTSTSGLPAIQATAEQLSSDGTRWVAVSSTPVNADGTFLIYPLPSSTSSAVYYDVVIHGPGIATIIIQSINVELVSCSSNSLSSSSCTTETTGIGTTGIGTTGTTDTTGTTTAGTTTTTGTTSTIGTTGLASSSSDTTGTATTSATATTTTGTSISVAAVSLGTLYPRAATSYTANLPASPAENLPAGTLIGFYETVGGANQVPHLIEASPIDPFNQVLANAQALSAGTIDYGTWTSTNANVTVVSAAPVEGAGGYTVSATAPSFAGGPLTSAYRISAPSGTTTTPVSIPTLPALSLVSGTSSGKLSVSVSEASPGKYNHGELLVSQNAQLVATASLDGVFASGAGGTVTVNNLPAETPAALYYVSVRAWNSSDPATTVHRQWYDTAVDLRSSASGTSELTIN